MSGFTDFINRFKSHQLYGQWQWLMELLSAHAYQRFAPFSMEKFVEREEEVWNPRSSI